MSRGEIETQLFFPNKRDKLFVSFVKSPAACYCRRQDVFFSLVLSVFLSFCSSFKPMIKRVLNITEKPSVAESVVKTLLGNNSAKPSFIGGNIKIWGFRYQFEDEFCEMIFMSVNGHLKKLNFIKDSSGSTDFLSRHLSLEDDKDKAEIIKTLKQLALSSQALILWLDNDYEGESIAYEVMEICKSANNSLENIKRARFSSLLDSEIMRAFSDLGVINMLVVDAVDLRKEIDLRAGYAFTTLQRTTLIKTFKLPIGVEKLSYGNCLLPVLGFVVEREWERKKHVRQQNISIQFETKSDLVSSSYIDLSLAKTVLEKCKNEHVATVVCVEMEEVIIPPPHPLTTWELLRRSSQFFSWTPEYTMERAQELYTYGLISYHCTTTNIFSSEFDWKSIVRKLQTVENYRTYAKKILRDRGFSKGPNNGEEKDNAHPPIHPVELSSGKELTEDQKRLHDFVVRHFLACLSSGAVAVETEVQFDIASENFLTSGSKILMKNFLEIYTYENRESPIATYYIGEKITTSLKIVEEWTNPVDRMTISDLLTCMETEKIGTDATAHVQISKLIDQGYVRFEDKYLIPTNLGLAIVEGYQLMKLKHELWKPNLRQTMEKRMNNIIEGVETKVDVLCSTLEEMKHLYNNASEKKNCFVEAAGRYFSRKDAT